jgi:hypothetical protein
LASAIERFLYGDAADLVSANGEVGDYFIAELCLAEGSVSLRIASERKPYSFRWVRFREAGLNSFSQTAATPDNLRLPWYIVGFYSKELDDGFWQFTLNCWHSRWSWSSRWPEVEDT